MDLPYDILHKGGCSIFRFMKLIALGELDCLDET